MLGSVGRGWRLGVCVAAGEAGGSFSTGVQRERRRADGVADRVRSAAEAERRARSKTRRYCAANRLNRLGTLTYAGAGCHDPLELRADVGEFFRSLRSLLGGDPFPYLWVPEWHRSGHGLHVHFAVGRFVARGLIEEAWGRGFVHIKLLGDLPVGSGSLAESRLAAGYLSKYLGKQFDGDRPPGLHRYEVAEGFQPEVVPVFGRTEGEVLGRASELMGGLAPETVWRSGEAWEGPPAVWAQWRG